MSKRYVYAVRYTCNQCGAQAAGWDDELPEGWHEDVTMVVHVASGKPEAMTAHQCPTCRAKEPAA